MKKYLRLMALALLVLMLCSAVACENGTPQTPVETTEEVTTQAPIETESESETQIETESET